MTNNSFSKFVVKQKSALSLEQYINGILSGNTTILARAITLIESQKQEHKSIADAIVSSCIAHSGKSIRIGITGVPGAGKSTFIEALGLKFIDNGKKVAVLAIDPSSEKSGGSILGDKTRMEKLSVHPMAFIRPSPTSGTLGGIAPKTRESIILCEAAGYDTIIVETVGVGQSETVVHSMTDFFLLIVLTGAGDDLQGMKRGIMEMADLIAINKADGNNRERAALAKHEYDQALHLFPPNPNGWKPKAIACSALTGEQIGEIIELIDGYLQRMKTSGWLQLKRQSQASYWLRQTLEHDLLTRFIESPSFQTAFKEIESKVIQGIISPFRAADILLQEFFGK